jgi:methylated-DNA-[protein]-cysteine S-methyltransferase
MVRYTIFKTKWGYFGLAATDNGLLRTVLPLANRKKVESQLLRNFPSSQYESGLFRKTQEQITAYFDGARVDFRDVPIVLEGLDLFAKRVLTVCRGITFGQTISYGQLAKIAGKPRSVRVVGRILAQNPLPLIIPCHRVICANGALGGFSATGGVNLKKKMLKLEGQLYIANL